MTYFNTDAKNVLKQISAFLQQMQNPAVQGIMTNPDALQAIMQIQEGMQRLQSVAPELYSSMGFPGIAVGQGPNMGSSTAANSAPTAETTTSSTTTTSSSSNSTSTTSSGRVGQNIHIGYKLVG